MLKKLNLFGGKVTVTRKEKFDWAAYWRTFIIIFLVELVYITCTTDWSKIFHKN
jgi:hypothetical protein